MMNMKNITTYTPDVNPYAGASVSIIFYRDEKGRDWYESQKLFAEDTLKVCYNDKKVIVQYSMDVSTLVPDGVSVAEVVNFTPEAGVNLADGTWIFDGKGIVKRTYTALEILQQAEDKRKFLVSSASDTISLWQTELLLGTISDDDRASLIQWMAYIKALQALDLSGITDESALKAINWPHKPT